jgi:hypothetical protein
MSCYHEEESRISWLPASHIYITSPEYHTFTYSSFLASQVFIFTQTL